MLKKRPSEYGRPDYGSSTFKTTRTYYDKLFKILEKPDKLELELVSASSLTGFIFKITTNESKSYIMKIVVLAPNDTDKRITLTNCAQSVNSLKYRTKLTETEDDFRYESQIQEYIYKNSKTGDRSPLCPKVEYAVIYKNDISNLFLTLLSDIGNSNSSTEIKSAIACLLYYFNNEFYNENGPYFFRLGIILMNEIPNSVTFKNFIRENSENDIAYSYIYYQLIYLFLIIGVINFDMHMDNALVYSDNGTIKTTLIDFGKGDNLKYLNNNRYLSYEEKEYINGIRERLKPELFAIIFSVEDQRQLKINFIMKTMNIINIICWIVNRKNFVYSDENPHRHQMNWFRPIDIVKTFMTDNIKNINALDMSSIINQLISKIDYIPDSQIPIISFDILKKNTITISTKNMNPKYTPIQEIDLVDNMPPINNSCKKNDGYDNGENGVNRMCVIMGGKKTRKTKRKYNTKFYIKSGKKSKRKTQKKSSRKTKRTHAK